MAEGGKMKLLPLLLISTLLPMYSYAKDCAMPEEIYAVNLRSLQSSMMVAALSCGQQDAYNRMIKKYHKDFAVGGKTLKNYFERLYGGKYEYQLNLFITKLANNATIYSMKTDPDLYCKETDKEFRKIITARKKQLRRYTEDKKYTSLHNFKECR